LLNYDSIEKKLLELKDAMKKTLIALIFISLSCFGDIYLNIEHAKTSQEISWGLMQRKYLAPNHGMLFHFSKPRQVKMWSFNCFIDLSIAFINSDGTILEIHPLPAFPEIMDPERPIFSPKDMRKYPKNDPIRCFFRKHEVSSSQPVAYALEVNSGWFYENKITVGDQIILHNKKLICIISVR
jgi:uncharacterized protein